MPLTLPLPDWMPWWGQLVVLIGAILFGFALLMMPFSVFGLKGRLDFLQSQLDDIHAELRMIATRLPDPERPVREPVFEELARPAPTRSPSPVQMPVQVPAQGLAQAPAKPRPVQAPVRMSSSVPPPPRQAAPPPPRFAGAGEPPRPAPQRLPGGDERRVPFPDDRVSGDWEDEEQQMAPRRPLRATTLRDPGRDFGRDQNRDPGREPARDRFRSEPTLRWPPR